MTTASAGGEALRAEVRQWLTANWDGELDLVAWRSLLADAGWACPAWPERFGGRGLSLSMAAIVATELATAGAPGPAEGVGMSLAAPTLLAHGAAELNDRFLRPTVTGEITWCQLLSEPGAGSDLAGLTTRAERDGDEWVVNGQKVWNTGAVQADYGLLVARSNWDVPKHEGITYFVFPMRQSGVEVRPLRQMNGHVSFNEVFLDDCRLPAANVVGEVGRGWTVALTTLAHERRLAPAQHRPPAGGAGVVAGRAVTEAAAERADVAEPHKWYPQRAGRADLLAERARAMGVEGDPLVRQAISEVVCLVALVSGACVEKAEAGHALFVLEVEREREVPTEREPGDDGPIGAYGIEDGRHVGDARGFGVRRRIVRRRAATVPADVPGDDTTFG